ncbi:SurA N-terminal domain-containing protein [Halosquirtibacter laminarini]|uniref:SurA N-terminal domain-containing protein n=1 Tax=Halosquirtibacter laminarini TaxID=3374600 RepID=A0AC61NMR7_9BACT|nr:SurA N-terminal domain-containing protein [Prolixibacteraceae bacterium]
MATLQKIRDKGGVWVGITIGGALLAFVLGGLLKSGSSFSRDEAMEIAEINGTSIKQPEYQKIVDDYTEVYKMRSGGASVDERVTQQIREQAWQVLVRKYVMRDVYEDLDIHITSDELLDMIQGENIHPMIKQLFGNPQTGEVNRPAIVQFLKSIETTASAQQKQYWSFLEDQMIKDREFSKYSSLINKGIFVTNQEAQIDLAERNNQFNINYVTKSYSSLSDSLVKVSDAEMKAYYEKNKENYKHNENTTIKYVVFNVSPSKEDDLQTKKWMEDRKDEFSTTANLTSFMSLNSDVAYDNNFVKPSDVASNLKALVQDGKSGDVYGPYQEGNSWKMAKIIEFKDLPDSVKARHILLPVRNQADLVKNQHLIDSLKTAIESNKTSFAAAAKKYSQDPGSASKGGELGWFRKGQMVPQFEAAAFSGKKGLQVVQSQFGFHLIDVEKTGKKSNNVKIAVLVRNIEPSTSTYRDVYDKASQFVAEGTNSELFDKQAEAMKVSPRIATLSKNQQAIAGITHSRSIIRSAFQAEEANKLILDNKQAAIFECDDNFVVALLSSKQEEGISSFNTVKAQVKLAVVKEKKGVLISKELKGSDLNSIASANNTTVKTAENLNFASYAIPGAGIEPAVIGAAASCKLNQVSAPVVGNNGVYVVQVTNKTKGTDNNVVAAQKRMSNEISYRAAFQAFNELREISDVKDFRIKFY